MTIEPIVLAHIAKAPRQAVWDAWTKSEEMEQWKAPEGFTIKVEQHDFRPSGSYRLVMTYDSKEYPAEGEYGEIVPPEKLTVTEVCGEEMLRANPNLPRAFKNTTTFEDLGDDTTKITLRFDYTTEADREKHLKLNPQEGWASTFKRLDEYLAQKQ